MTLVPPDDTLDTVEALETLLSDPPPAAVEAMGALKGDVLILGVGGKMGPTLARMARRTSDAAGVNRRVIGVSRFSEPESKTQLSQWGVETIATDLTDGDQLAALPDAPNVIFMAGMKFGSTGREALTWAMNTFLPAMVAGRFIESKIVAFGTGNVYGLSPIAWGGSVEADALYPEGDYAMSCVGRERMFEHFSRLNGTAVAVLRLNYAVEMRYGVLVDLATKVWEGRPIDLAMGAFNAIWQGDASAMALQAFSHAASPPFVMNVAGPELLSVRRVSEQFGQLMGRPVRFAGAEAPDALLSNGQAGHRLFGYPRIPIDRLIRWTADWVARGGKQLGKPTHFEARDGKF